MPQTLQSLWARGRIPILALLFCAIWSSAFVATKIGLHAAPPLWLATLRFLAAGPLMLGVDVMLGQGLPAWSRSLGILALLGLLNNTIYLGLTFVALQTVSAGLVSVLASTNPLMTALLAHPFLGEKLTWRKVVGLGLGFLGVMFIMQHRMGGTMDAPLGMGIALAGVLSLVIGTVIFKRFRFDQSLLVVNGVQVTAGGLALLPFALLTEDFGRIVPGEELFYSVAYLGLVVSVGGTLLWFYLLRTGTASTVSTYHFLNPALGLFFGWLVLAEPVSWIDYLGIVPVAAGILLVSLTPSRRKGLVKA